MQQKRENTREENERLLAEALEQMQYVHLR